MFKYFISNTFLLVLFFVFTVQSYGQAKYFQQEVNYNIKAKLDDIRHEIEAFETIEYTNNSTNSLDFIFFHLWPNAYKNKSTAFAKQMLENASTDFHFASEKERGYIDSLDFKVNGKQLKWEYHSEHIDICKVYLESPINPGETVKITTPFHVKIPSDFSRLGHVGQSYQITQWFPKPAVYDCDGWHEMPYLDQGEFYSEYGTFDVEITLPKNYIVGATGNLQTKEEIIRLNEIAEETSKIQTFDPRDMNFPNSSPEFKTIRFSESNVHDFAWFADKRYHVLKDSVYLENTNHWVTTWSMFTNRDGQIWKRSPEYIKDAIFYYSKWYGDYPYNNCTAVRGALSAGGGMEYPTITVIGSFSLALELEEVIMHEVGHNWFYGILGFNERDYPYLDEGLNSFSEFRYLNTKYNRKLFLYEVMGPKSLAELANVENMPLENFYSVLMLLPSRLNKDQPMNSHSEDFTSLNYGVIGYHKSALSYYYLLHYLGEEKFNKVMQEFYAEWKFKHPGPKELQHAFESSTDKNLSWFFDELISTTKKIDYKVLAIKENKIKIRNKGEINSPISLTGYSGTEKKFHFIEEGFDKNKWFTLPGEEIDKVLLNDIEIPELNKKNNTIKTEGIAKKSLPLDVKSIQIVEKEDTRQLGVIPAMGWNYYNKFMFGALFYNPLVPFQKIEYQLSPMFAFGNKSLSGSGQITVHTFPAQKIFERVDFKVSGVRFGFGEARTQNFNRYSLSTEFFFRKKRARSPFSHSLIINFTGASDIFDVLNNREGISSTINYTNFYNANYQLRNKNTLHPSTLTLSMEGSDYSVKAIGEYNYARKNSRKVETFRIRAFVGVFLNSPDNNLFALKISGNSGITDYQYNHLYFGRFETPLRPDSHQLLSQQFERNEGGFAGFITLASRKWLTSLNGDYRPTRYPFYLYLNLALYGSPEEIVLPAETRKANMFVYETGAYFEITKTFQVYFPVAFSKDIMDNLDYFAENYWQQIRFKISIKSLNPTKLRDLMF